MGGFSIDYSAAIEGNARSYRNALENDQLPKIQKMIDKIEGLSNTYNSTNSVLVSLYYQKNQTIEDIAKLDSFITAYTSFKQKVQDVDDALEKEFAAKFRADKYEKFKDNGGFGMIVDAVQVGLDGLGIIVPGIGDICDGVNGLIYLLRGDGTGAVISFAAAIPIWGIAATGGKYLDNIGGLGKKGSDIVYGIGKAGKVCLQRCDATVRRVLADALKKGKESDILKMIDSTLTLSGGKVYVRLKDGTVGVIDTVAEKYSDNVCRLLYEGCFKGETLVSTEDGLIPIKDIVIGDKVLSKNQDTGAVSYKNVSAVIKKSIDEICTITLSSGEKIETTTGHLFMIKDRWWTAAVRIEVGDFIETKKGIYEEISNIEVESLNYPMFVYNLTVDDNHTFYVGENGCLTHNSKKCGLEEAAKAISNMNEFFSSGFGKSIKNNLSKTKLQYDGQSIYKVINKTGNEYLKKGYGVYLDALHKDHLEIIDKAGKVKYVLNLDGTLNADKTAKAIGRTIKGW